MTDDFGTIQPKSVPLSVGNDTEPESLVKAPAGHRPLLAGLSILAVVVLGAVFWLVPDLIEPVDPAQVSRVSNNPTERQPSGLGSGEPLPPFEALQQAKAREEAQTELTAFVERQLKLEESMTVGAWGQEDYDAAKELASAGDKQFVAERFDESLTSYRAATEKLGELIERGETIRRDALAEGQAALDDRDKDRADAAFTLAQTIDPNNAEATAGLARAAHLPEIQRLLRDARNEELADNWGAALTTYKKVEALDPNIRGLEELVAQARIGERRQSANGLLSQGFAALDKGRFDAARKAFNEALRLRPGDPVALGGLEQVNKGVELSGIEQHRTAALRAVTGEDWEAAVRHYQAALAIDPNLQFARSGLTDAQAQQRTASTLTRIIDAPNKLSSQKLFGDAQDILARAKTLEPRGPRLGEQIQRVEELLKLYSVPIEVTFRSDNRTEIVLSTVGELGVFSEKQLELRPGAYTVVGTRDGCRDVRESIVVRPGMPPVVIRCQESF